VRTTEVEPVRAKARGILRGLSRPAFLLVDGADTARGRARNLNDLAGSRGPVIAPERPLLAECDKPVQR
jgi:hypothetical protein